MRAMFLTAALTLWAASANAQGFSGYTVSPVGNTFNGSFAGAPLASDAIFVTRGTFNGPGNTSALPLGAFASQADIQALSARIDAGNGPASAALVTIASRLDRLADRFHEGIALAGAVNVLPPNPGDRFAVSFGGAGYDGAGAGSVAVSARLNESTIAYVGYARGPTQNLVKGGVGFSFR